VLTVSETFRQFGLDFDATAAWGYQPNPAGVDGLEIDAFIAYGDAIAARFGEQPLDPLGRQRSQLSLTRKILFTSVRF